MNSIFDILYGRTALQDVPWPWGGADREEEAAEDSNHLHLGPAQGAREGLPGIKLRVSQRYSAREGIPGIKLRVSQGYSTREGLPGIKLRVSQGYSTREGLPGIKLRVLQGIQQERYKTSCLMTHDSRRRHLARVPNSPSCLGDALSRHL